MTPKYYAIDPNGNVTEADASSNQPIEVIIDLDLALPPHELQTGLLAIANYISRNLVVPPATVPPRAAEQPPPEAQVKS